MRLYLFAGKICFQCNVKVFEKSDKLVFSHAQSLSRFLVASDIS